MYRCDGCGNWIKLTGSECTCTIKREYVRCRPGSFQEEQLRKEDAESMGLARIDVFEGWRNGGS